MGQAGPRGGAQRAGGGRRPTSHAGLPGAGRPGAEHVSFTRKASPSTTHPSGTRTKAPSTPATALTVPGKLRDRTPRLSHGPALPTTTAAPRSRWGSGVSGHRNRSTARLRTLTRTLCDATEMETQMPTSPGRPPVTLTLLTARPAYQLTLNPRKESAFPAAPKLPQRLCHPPTGRHTYRARVWSALSSQHLARPRGTLQVQLLSEEMEGGKGKGRGGRGGKEDSSFCDCEGRRRKGQARLPETHAVPPRPARATASIGWTRAHTHTRAAHTRSPEHSHTRSRAQ